MRNVLIRPHDNHASCLAIDAAHCKDVITALDVGAKYLLVVVKSVTSLPREKECGHSLDGEFTMMLLEYCTDLDHRINIVATARILSDRRVLIFLDKIAQLTDGTA